MLTEALPLSLSQEYHFLFKCDDLFVAKQVTPNDMQFLTYELIVLSSAALTEPLDSRFETARLTCSRRVSKREASILQSTKQHCFK